MNSQPDTLAIPERSYLSARAATVIRRAIQERRWQEFLPSERRLCDLLRVSRPTVRAAVHLLAKEGLVEVSHGRRSRLLSGPARKRAPQSRLVVLVANVPISHFPQFVYQSISEMRTHLAEHGFSTEILICQRSGSTAQRHKIETFIQHNPVFCCVLLSVSRELQLWFSERSIPALVLGSCHPGVKLPSLDLEYRSVCRHAAGIFLSQGHRRMALIVSESGVAGDLASEQGFREAVAQRKTPDGAHADIVHHNGTLLNLTSKLDLLFNAPNPPTALLVAKTHHMLWVITYLLRRGLTVPDTVSLIARDHENLFESAVSHYTFASDTFARRLSHLMLQMVEQGFLAPEPNLIFPKYCSGGTVKQLA